MFWVVYVCTLVLGTVYSPLVSVWGLFWVVFLLLGSQRVFHASQKVLKRRKLGGYVVFRHAKAAIGFPVQWALGRIAREKA